MRCQGQIRRAGGGEGAVRFRSDPKARGGGGGAVQPRIQDLAKGGGGGFTGGAAH